MKDILPTYGHKWNVRSALAFKAAVLHLKKEHLPVTGPTDEKTLYRHLVSQARLQEALLNTGQGNPGTPHPAGASGYTPTSEPPAKSNKRTSNPTTSQRRQNIPTNPTYTFDNLPTPFQTYLDVHQRMGKIDIYGDPKQQKKSTQPIKDAGSKQDTKGASATI